MVKVVHPLPRAWRRELRNLGFDVPEQRCRLLFAAFVLLLFGYGVVMMVRQLASNALALVRPSALPAGPFVYFDGMSAGTLPQPGADGRSHDFVSWYQQWDGRLRDVEALCHGVAGSRPRESQGVPLLAVPSATLPLEGGLPTLRLLAWMGGATVISALDLLRGRWWHAMLLNEAAKGRQMRLQRADRVAREFLIHNSRLTFRPLWTYEAEAKGARVTFYFYSTNVEGFQPPDVETPPQYGWRAMNWPHYLVWDDALGEAVRRSVGPGARISVVGPIWFNTSDDVMPAIGTATIAVFDVTPFRRSIYMTAAPDREFYVPATSLAFLRDSYRAARDTGYTMVWKRKRNIGRLAHARYRRFADDFAAMDGVAAVNPDISPVRVVEASDIVISMPFTSTALIARHMGKPSCYYDPRALLRSDDRAAHGLPVLQSAEALAAWVRQQSKRSLAG